MVLSKRDRVRIITAAGYETKHRVTLQKNPSSLLFAANQLVLPARTNFKTSPIKCWSFF